MFFLSLRKLLERTPRHLVEDALLSFSCSRDIDIESFSQKRAILFDEVAKSRTYLFIDDHSLLHGKIEIVAFFSMALQVLNLPAEMTNRQRKSLDGFSGKIHGEKISSLPVMLIGQLAKNDKHKNRINGNEILKRALLVAQKANETIGGRIVLVDVKTQASGLVNFYRENSFELIYDDKKTGFSQMIYKLYS